MVIIVKNSLYMAYFITFFCHLLAFIFGPLKKRAAERTLALTALTANGGFLILIRMLYGHWTLFNVFEGFLPVTFVLGGLGLFCSRSGERLPEIRMWVWAEVMLLLLITLPFPSLFTMRMIPLALARREATP
jgi:hypothetical protein